MIVAELLKKIKNLKSIKTNLRLRTAHNYETRHSSCSVFLFSLRIHTIIITQNYNKAFNDNKKYIFMRL